MMFATFFGPSNIRGLLLVAALASLLRAGPAGADAVEQDAVRRAVQQGEIRPLTEILDSVRDQLPGDVIGVEIDRKAEGRWLYELRVLNAQGRLYEVYIDAHTGAIDRIEEK
ncbi:MAG: PepSY domain-containing protein [Pseudomonadota bacterium]